MKKHFILLICILFLPVTYILADSERIYIEKIEDKTPPAIPTYQDPLENIDAIIKGDDIYVMFNEPVGGAMVSVDNSGNNVACRIVSTQTESMVIISTSGWENGEYTLTIETECEVLQGEFNL